MVIVLEIGCDIGLGLTAGIDVVGHFYAKIILRVIVLIRLLFLL